MAHINRSLRVVGGRFLIVLLLNFWCFDIAEIGTALGHGFERFFFILADGLQPKIIDGVG